ncbi:MAG TPA: ferritin-like domain-containing protein [Polyangiaceae bacterium]|jgi:hypothetical protein
MSLRVRIADAVDQRVRRALKVVPEPPPSETKLKEPSAVPNYTELARALSTPAKVGPRGTESLQVEYSMAYSWEYNASRLDLRALYEKSKDLMWNARTLAWSTDVDPQSECVPDAMNPIYGSALWRKLDAAGKIPELRQHIASYLISNFLHGEQGALLATAQIVNCAPGPDAKLYAAAQVMDEARHVEAYDRYLRDKIELVYPITKPLKTLLDAILTDSRWDMKYLGMQIMVEGIALAAFGLIHQSANEPLIREITERIMQDESRHVAFGVLSLKDVYRDMPENERRDREDFIVESSMLMRDRFLGQDVWDRFGLPQKECQEAADQSEMMQLFRTLLFSKIVPNVKRLGLLTPRVRQGFADLGVLHFESLAESA